MFLVALSCVHATRPDSFLSAKLTMYFILLPPDGPHSKCFSVFALLVDELPRCCLANSHYPQKDHIRAYELRWQRKARGRQLEAATLTYPIAAVFCCCADPRLAVAMLDDIHQGFVGHLD